MELLREGGGRGEVMITSEIHGQKDTIEKGLPGLACHPSSRTNFLFPM